MSKSISVFGILLVLMTVIDLIWLGVVATPFYRQHLGFLMNDTLQLLPGVLFYLLYCIGLFVFVVEPLRSSASLGEIFLRGLLFGLICYATYDLTNQATIKNWPLIVTVVDMTWGAVVGGTVSLATVMVARFLKIG